MRVTCSHCEKAYSIPGDVLGNDGRHMRCGECGTRWWQAGEGSGVAHAHVAASAPARPSAQGPGMLERREDRGSRALIVSDNGGYREEARSFSSFFDGISSRFTTPVEDSATQFSERFQRLRQSRQQRRLRDANAIVEAEFKEIRDFGRLRDWCRIWLPRIVVMLLFISAIALALLAA